LGAALTQRRRVGSRSAQRARAPTPALLGDPQARRSTPPPDSRTIPTRTNSPAPQPCEQPRPHPGAPPGARAGARPGAGSDARPGAGPGAQASPLATAGAWEWGRWGRREAQRPGRRAQRASWTDPPSLSERSGPGPRSEFDGATRPRASQRSRPSGRPLPPALPPGPRCREANAKHAKHATPAKPPQHHDQTTPPRLTPSQTRHPSWTATASSSLPGP
jgi:hypothetical protein